MRRDSGCADSKVFVYPCFPVELFHFHPGESEILFRKTACAVNLMVYLAKQVVYEDLENWEGLVR